MDIPAKDNQAAIMSAVGPMIPAMLRESVDDGLYTFQKSRSGNPDGFTHYCSCTRMNMFYDHVTTSVRELVGLASGSVPGLSWKINANKRSTEVYLDPFFAFRFKRVKPNRNGLSTGVNTRRRRAILSEFILPGQMVLDPSWGLCDESRIWLTVAYDFDPLEESFTEVSIGVETRKRFLWKQSLAEAEADAIMQFPSSVSDRIIELRERRSA